MSDSVDQLKPADSVANRRGLSARGRVLLMGGLVAVFVIGLAFVRQQQAPPTTGLAPDFTLITFDGTPFRLSDQRGKIVVINFWASWCGPCRQEAPALQRVWEHYRDEDVVILGVTYVDEVDDSRAFMQEHGLTYPNAADARSEVSDNLYHIQGVPQTFVINQNGEVAQSFYAALDEQTLISVIDGLLPTD